MTRAHRMTHPAQPFGGRDKICGTTVLRCERSFRQSCELVKCLLLIALTAFSAVATGNESQRERVAFRGPVNVALVQERRCAATANELAGSVSLVDLSTRRVLDEVACGGHPVDLVALAENRLAVSCSDSGQVLLLDIRDQRLQLSGRIHVGMLPHGLATNAQGRLFVGLVATGEVAELDVVSQSVTRRFFVGNWPRYLALSADGSRLAVGLSGDSCISVVDVKQGVELYREPLSGGINLGHMRISADGLNVYFPWMVYRSNPIDVRNIRRGWILASRVARVRLDGPADREALSLDAPGLAVADPFGVAIAPNEHRLTLSSSGTHELLVYRLNDLPFVGAGGPGDLIDNRLLRDNDLFYRISVGGRPMGLQYLDDRSVLVANHTLDCLQIVDIESRRMEAQIQLGTRPEPTDVHRGMQIFYDGVRSLDQWYSCQSCHLDGGSNAKAMDTWNDGSPLTVKTVLPLFGVTQTAPWTWHGWQQDIDESIQNSFTETMQGKAASAEDVAAVRAYLASLKLPPNPFLQADGSLSEAAQRGKQLFENREIACASCHVPPTFSDGLNHDVGLGSKEDKYPEHNTPSLLGLYRRVRFLHDGRAKSLEAVLEKYHGPERVSGGPALTEQQIADLVAYLKSL